VAEPAGGSTPDELRVLVEGLVARVAALQAEVVKLRSKRAVAPSGHDNERVVRRSLPTDGEPVDLAVLATWVVSLQVRYATSSDWLKPCWWRHGGVIEELAALREAWLAVYDTDEPVDRSAGLRWHEEAERCRERIRKTIGLGSGCSLVSHVPDELVTGDPRWIDELTALMSQSSGE